MFLCPSRKSFDERRLAEIEKTLQKIGGVSGAMQLLAEHQNLAGYLNPNNLNNASFPPPSGTQMEENFGQHHA